MSFVPFFFDGNKWCGVIDGPEPLKAVLEQYSVDRFLDCKMAPQDEIAGVPRKYHFGAPQVRNGTMPSFGFRREHIPGTLRLSDWAKENGMDLQSICTNLNN